MRSDSAPPTGFQKKLVTADQQRHQQRVLPSTISAPSCRRSGCRTGDEIERRGGQHRHHHGRARRCANWRWPRRTLRTRLDAFFMARTQASLPSVRRSTKMKGMIRHPMKNGIRQPQAATVSAGITLAQEKADQRGNEKWRPAGSRTGTRCRSRGCRGSIFPTDRPTRRQVRRRRKSPAAGRPSSTMDGCGKADRRIGRAERDHDGADRMMPSVTIKPLRRPMRSI